MLAAARWVVVKKTDSNNQFSVLATAESYGASSVARNEFIAYGDTDPLTTMFGTDTRSARNKTIRHLYNDIAYNIMILEAARCPGLGSGLVGPEGTRSGEGQGLA